MKRPLKALLSWSAIFFLALIIYRSGWFNEGRGRVELGELVYETNSDYSHIRIREKHGVRTLIFVTPEGRETKQSSIDLSHPTELQLAYSKFLFASMLFEEHHERVLVVGLGGGGMIRFLNEAFPEVQVDAVEIDPEVVRVADEYFETRPGEKTKIITEDAFVYLKQEHEPYDAIYMDAFLQPPAHSDLGEKTKRLKQVAFLKSLHSQLKEDGVVAFNLVTWSHTTPGDLESIWKAFPNAYQFHVPNTGNLVVIATMDKKSKTREELESRARELDQQLHLPFRFQDLVSHMK